jgi:glc operon protein GlcG
MTRPISAALPLLAFPLVALVAISPPQARAQTPPAQFVVSGKAAEAIHDFTTINLATAQRLAEICEGHVAEHGGQHTIMVLDNDGNHVYMDRMDGQGYTNIVTAEFKARTALLTRGPSKAVLNRVTRDPSSEPYEIQLGLYPVAGGLPIFLNNQMIGSIGVGGFPPNPPVWSDEICAHTSLTEVFGAAAVAPLIEDVRPARETGSAEPPRFAAATPPKQTVAPEYVVTGAGAAHIFDAHQISLAAAKKLARACRDWAAAKNLSASIYVLDTAGEMIHMERMDGQFALDMKTALLKAQTALKFREPTSQRGARLSNDPHELPRYMSSDIFEAYLGSGGVPIVVDSQLIGAVGVSGLADRTAGFAANKINEDCAVEGLKSAFNGHATLPVYGAAK